MPPEQTGSPVTSRELVNPDELAVGPLSAASPEMDDAAFQALMEDIDTMGQQVPVVLDGERAVLDGRKRVRACQRLGRLVWVVWAAGQDPAALARSLNLMRTHYTAGQRAMLGAALATIARDRLNSDDGAKPPLPLTEPEAARRTGSIRSEIAKAKRIRREAAPEVVAAVEAGALTLHGAEQIRRQVPRERQAAVVAEVLKGPAPGRTGRRSTARVLGTAPRGHASPRRPVERIIARALTQLLGTLEVLEERWDTVARAQHVDAPRWAAQLGAIRLRVSRLLRRLPRTSRRPRA